GVPLVIGSNEADVSADSLSGSPMLWEPAEVSLDRLEQVLPRFLIGAHWADARWGSDPRCATVETRIGVVTFDQPDWRSAYTKNLANPRTQLTGSIGVGWSPFSDVNIQDFDAAARAPGQRCMDVLKRAGLAPVDNNSSILAAPSCEGPYFAAAAFGRWLDSPPSNGLVDAVNGLGSSYQPTGTFSASFRA